MAGAEQLHWAGDWPQWTQPMPSVCFYFQVHQPPRLRRYSVFDTGHDYFDDECNRAILRKVAHKCYLPATQILLDLFRRHDRQFRVAFSLTGIVIEQFQRFAPELIDRFQQMAQTGCVEFLSETYEHSLAWLYSRQEFRDQVERHADLIDHLFGQSPTVFRNTELIYSNDLAAFITDMRSFRGILAEGADQVLGGRSPNHIYEAPHPSDLAVLLKNYRLSDDIAFRFSNRQWTQWPLTADKYADWIHGTADSDSQLCNLFMDFETFGEHQWEQTGILEFLRNLPDRVLARGDDFRTPGECIETYDPVGLFDAPGTISWADTERDLSAWVGNAMQSSALDQLYQLESSVKQSGDDQLLADWRRLTCSDHYYYMCTKYYADGEVHKYFNPYQSPYDSYINFMNVLDSLRSRVESKAGVRI